MRGREPDSPAIVGSSACALTREIIMRFGRSDMNIVEKHNASPRTHDPHDGNLGSKEPAFTLGKRSVPERDSSHCRRGGRANCSTGVARRSERLARFDEQREKRFAVVDRMRAAFADVPTEEIEREAARAVADVRAEMAAERKARALDRMIHATLDTNILASSAIARTGTIAAAVQPLAFRRFRACGFWSHPGGA